MSTSAGAARSRSPPKAELAPHGPVAHAGDSRRKLHLPRECRPVVDRELHVFPACQSSARSLPARFRAPPLALSSASPSGSPRLRKAMALNRRPCASAGKQRTWLSPTTSALAIRAPQCAKRGFGLSAPACPDLGALAREFEGAVKAPRFQDNR